MKLYALLTFLLALPLFVRLLPETVDETASAPAPETARAKPVSETSAPVKPAESPAPAPADKLAQSSDVPREQTH